MKFKIIELESVASTNDEIKKLAESGEDEGCTVIALSQTSGKGSKGRSFISPNGGLYLSLLLRPKSTEHITAMAAVAGAKAISSLCDADIGIKWTNDLYLNGKKLSGILTEAVFSSSDIPEYVVLGIGINIKHVDFDNELKNKATSLEDMGYDIDRGKLAEAFLFEFDKLYSKKSDWLSYYRKRSVVLGKCITVMTHSECYKATAEAIDDDGGLIISKENGEKLTLISGEVSITGNF